MIKKLALFLFTVSMLSACGGSDSSSGGSDSAELNSGSTSTASTSDSSSSSSSSSTTSEKACLDGRYELRTDSDNKRHFDAVFRPDGIINYNLNGGPSGSWTLDGSTVRMVGPFGANRSDATLTLTVTQQNSECLVTQMRGSSLGGAAITITRI